MKSETAKMIVELVDVHGWSLKAAKAKLKSVTGHEVKARSKDDFVSIVLSMVN